MKLVLLVLSVSFLASSVSIAAASAELKLAGVFTDHAVLQRDAPVPVWSTAAPGDTITVTFAGQSVSSPAGDDGAWRVTLDPLAASATPRTLSVQSKFKDRKAEIENVLVGEVWLCSGQSNMAMPVANARDAEQETASATFPQIRVFNVDRVASPAPATHCGGQWVVCAPETAGKFSATAFYFGRELHRELAVPVGHSPSAGCSCPSSARNRFIGRACANRCCRPPRSRTPAWS